MEQLPTSMTTRMNTLKTIPVGNYYVSKDMIKVNKTDFGVTNKNTLL